MKTAGEVLSALFDERFMKKAQSHSKLYDSWKDITAKNGIAAAADHCGIKNLDRGILLIETDHPGWKQLLQTKQTKILNDFRMRFPELEISGISLMLTRAQGSRLPDRRDRHDDPPETPQPAVIEKPPQQTEPTTAEQAKTATLGYDAIKDEGLRNTLKKLGQTIAKREKQ